MEEFIDAVYLGKDTEDSCLSSHPNGRYFKVQMNINGRNIWVYLVRENKQRYKYMKFEGSAPSLTVVGWYDFDDPEFGEEFKKRGFDQIYSANHSEYNFEHDEDEPEQSISLLEVQVPMPYEYEPNEKDSPFFQNFHRTIAQINTKLFEMKKRYIMMERKRQFLERLSIEEEMHPEIKLSNVMSQFDKDDRERAFGLYDKLIYCIMKGKYSFSDYIIFMTNLPSVIHNQGIIISEGNVRRYENRQEPTTTTTFYQPSNLTIAGLCPKERDWDDEEKIEHFKNSVTNINSGTDNLLYIPLLELDQDDKGEYFRAPGSRIECRAIGTTPNKEIIAIQEDGEVFIIPERNRLGYIVRRTAPNDGDYDDR